MPDRPDLEVRPATAEDRDELARMRSALWPRLPVDESRAEVDAILRGRLLGGLPWALLVAHEAGRAVGFVELKGCEETPAASQIARREGPVRRSATASTSRIRPSARARVVSSQPLSARVD